MADIHIKHCGNITMRKTELNNNFLLGTDNISFEIANFVNINQHIIFSDSLTVTLKIM